MRGGGAGRASQSRELAAAEDRGVWRHKALAQLGVASGIQAEVHAESVGQRDGDLVRVVTRGLRHDPGRIDRPGVDRAQRLHYGLGLRLRSARLHRGRLTGRGGGVLLSARCRASLLRRMGAGRPCFPYPAWRIPRFPGRAGERPLDHLRQRARGQSDGRLRHGDGEHDLGAVRWDPPLQRSRRSGPRHGWTLAGASDPHQLQLTTFRQDRPPGERQSRATPVVRARTFAEGQATVPGARSRGY
jgi:hypothetical protein